MQSRRLTGGAPIIRPPTHIRFGRAVSRRLRRAAQPAATSTAGIVELVGHEAIVVSSYWDSVNVLTLYVGHTRAAGAPIPVLPWTGDRTIPTALAVLRRDLAKRYEPGVRAAFTRQLSQAQFDAALSFHYNTGAIAVASWVKLWNTGRDAEARVAFMAWNKPASIIGRRTAECRLFFDGVYGNTACTAPLVPANDRGLLDWGHGVAVDVRPYLGSHK